MSNRIRRAIVAAHDSVRARTELNGGNGGTPITRRDVMNALESALEAFDSFGVGDQLEMASGSRWRVEQVGSTQVSLVTMEPRVERRGNTYEHVYPQEQFAIVTLRQLLERGEWRRV